MTAAAPLLLALLTAAPGASADGDGTAPGPQETRIEGARLDSLTAAVAGRLRCPVCRNQSVLESTAELSRRMQSVIRERLSRGESPEQVEAYFVDKYGPWILLKPEPRGLNLLVYLLPAAALAAGTWIAWRAIRRWRAAGAGEPGSGGGAPGRGPADGSGPGTAGPGAGAEPGRSEDSALSPEEREWVERQIREED